MSKVTALNDPPKIVYRSTIQETKCRDFFEVIDSRDNLKSTVIVSQLPVKSWYDLFADNTYADACLDRIIHKAFRLELNGKNMRNPS